MNREIKFRAWDGERLRKVNVIGWDDEGVDFVTTPRYSGPAEDFRLMQSTGLKDKNGVEIYEGDIVETQQSDLTSVPHEMVGGIVEWDSKNAMYKIKPIYGSKFHPITMFVHDVVVVGSKFENPELLESEAE